MALTREYYSACGLGVCALGRQAVTGIGSIPASIAIVGEAPGREELRVGEPFKGPAGRLLDKLLSASGLTRSEVFLTNVCACVDMTREDRRPLPAELDACRPRLEAELVACEAKVAVLVGNSALSLAFPGYRIGEVYGQCRAVGGRIYVAAYHPAAALRSGGQSSPLCETIVAALSLARRLSVE